MAEVTAFRNNALNCPIYGAPWAVVFPILDNTGAPVTGVASPDCEISKNGDTFADATNEMVEIGQGVYYLLLTATEMTADVVAIITKQGTTDAKPTIVTLYPRKLVTVTSGTAQGGAAGSITLASGASAVNDTYNGCVVIGTLDGSVEARVITDYVGSTRVASVVPDWVTTPDSDDTYVIKQPESRQVVEAAVSSMGASTITQAAIATDAIGADEIAAAAVTKIQNGLATASAVATVDTVVDAIAALLTDTDTDVAAIRAVTDLLIAAQAEITTLPASNATPLAKLAYLFQAVYHRLDTTNAKKTFYNGSGSAIYEQDLTDNGTTMSQSKVNAL